MNDTLAVFEKDGFTTRTITDEDGEIWFVPRTWLRFLVIPKALLIKSIIFSGISLKYGGGINELWSGLKTVLNRNGRCYA